MIEVINMIVAGIDCGAKNTKTVIMNDKKLLGKGIEMTGFDQDKAVERSLAKALKEAGLEIGDIDAIGSTGAGMEDIKDAKVKVNEIKAMAKAANFFFPNARTVTDVGAEMGRAAKINEEGKVEDFAINEKCAAGAGAFIEAMARALEVDLTEMGPMANASEKAIPMNAQCAIFAESEVVGLIHAKTEKKDISKAIHDAMSSRIVSMIRKIGVNRDIVMIGGVGLNPGFVESMRRELDVGEIFIPEDPAFSSAIGAALVTLEEA